MKTIWKYPLSVSDRQVLMMPPGAKFLSVQRQQGATEMWWLVDDDVSATVPRVLCVFGTGHPIPNAGRLTFYGTFQEHGGLLVFHLFEEAPS